MMDKVTYQPKAGMCKSCNRKFDDCSHLDFSKMRVMSADGWVREAWRVLFLMKG